MYMRITIVEPNWIEDITGKVWPLITINIIIIIIIIIIKHDFSTTVFSNVVQLC